MSKAVTPLAERLPLECLTIDTLSQNIEDNLCWKERHEIESVKEQAKVTYTLYQEVMKRGADLSEMAATYDIPRSSLYAWKHQRKVPRILKIHRRSYLPKTADQRIAFAYVLGLFATDSRIGEEEGRHTSKRISNKGVQKKAAKVIRSFTGRKPITTGDQLIFNHHLFSNIVRHVRKTGESPFLTTAEEKRSYLDGFFTASDSKFQMYRGGLVYVVHCLSTEKIKVLADALFVQGIYPDINPEGTRLYIRDRYNLRKIQELDLVCYRHQKRKLAEYLAAPTAQKFVAPATYYQARAVAYKYRSNPKALNMRQACMDLEVGISAFRSWTADILRLNDPIKKPDIVKTYEELCKYLGKENPHADPLLDYRGIIWYKVPWDEARALPSFGTDDWQRWCTQDYSIMLKLASNGGRNGSLSREPVFFIAEPRYKQLFEKDRVFHDQAAFNRVVKPLLEQKLGLRT